MGLSNGPGTMATVVVDDLGAGGFAAASVVAKALRREPGEVARLLLTAPSQLAGPLEAALAREVADALQQAGLTARAVPDDQSWTGGEGTYEIALSPVEFRDLAAVLREVCHLLGCTPKVGIRLLTSTPAVLLTGVSERNVEVLRRRFAPLGVEVDASDMAEARYQVVVTVRTAEEQVAASRVARELGVELARQPGGSTLLATDLPRASAVPLVEALTATAVPVRGLDTALQRFDVVLDDGGRAAARDAVAAVLVERCGVPPSHAARVAASRGVVVAPRRPWAETAEILAALHAQGCAAHAEMVSGLLFDLEVVEVGDGAAAARTLEEVGGLSPVRTGAVRRGRPGRLEGPFSYNLAQWLRAELRRSGTQVRLVRLAGPR